LETLSSTYNVNVKKKITGKRTNLAEFARKLGISKQLLNHYLKEPAAPKLTDEKAWIDFIAVHGREGSGPPDLRRAIAAKRLELISEQVAREKRLNAEAMKELVPWELVQKAQQFADQTFCAQIQRFVRDWPAVMEGLTAVEMRKKMQEDADAILPTLKEAFTNHK